MSFTERISSRSIGRDRNNKLRGQRVFDVDSPPPTALLEPGLPTPGVSIFPGYPTAQCDALEATYADGTIQNAVVTATFTDDRTGTFGGNGGVNPMEPGYRSWSVDFRVIEVAIPYVIRDLAKYAYVDTATNPPTEKNITGYTEEEDSHGEIFNTVVLRVNITAPFGPDEIELIELQVNKLHFIGGRWYRYTAGLIEETEPNRWKVEHIWERDPGTPDIYPVNTPTSAVLWPGGLLSVIPGIPGLWARPPFHKIVVVPGAYDPGPPPFAGPPSFQALPQYVADPNGHLTLPGWN